MNRIFIITSALVCFVFAGLATAQSVVQRSVLVQAQAGKKEAPPEDVPYDHAPLPINQVRPKYPDLALRAGLEGTVWVKLWVDETGKVVKATAVNSDAEIFNQAAVEAATQWTFRPALLKGKQVAVWVSVPFRFKITGYPSETTSEGSLGKMVLGESRRLGIPNLVLVGAAILVFWLIPLIFAVVALLSILKSQFPGPNDKVIWTIVAIFVPVIGPILYFVLGRKQRTQIA